MYDGLVAGENKVTARFARRDNEEGTAPDWTEPKEVTLSVKFRDKTVKFSGKTLRAGELLSVNVKSFGWAEYGPQDYSDQFGWECEGWRMQILGVVK